MASWNPISATLETVVGAVEKYFPDQITKDKAKADIFAQTAGLQLQLNKVDADREAARLADLNSARQMQMTTKSVMPAAMTIFSLLLFSSLLVWAVAGDKIGWTMPEQGTRHDIIMMAVTLIIREVIAAFAFWMGSSESSKSKDATIANLQG